MATAPDKPSISATPRSYNVKIDYGLTSFGDPNSGTLSLYKLPITIHSSPLDTQTAVGDYSYIVNAGSSAWANTQSSYRVIADNGTLTTNSDDVTVVTLPPNFSISGNTIEAFNIGTNSFDVQWHPAALGTKYQVDLYASIDNKNTWTLVAQNIQNATDYTYSFSGLASSTTYTVYTQARDSAGRIVDVISSDRIPVVTTLFAPKLYGSVNGQTKEVKKLYGSINGQTKEIEKLYGSVEVAERYNITPDGIVVTDIDGELLCATAKGQYPSTYKNAASFDFSYSGGSYVAKGFDSNNTPVFYRSGSRSSLMSAGITFAQTLSSGDSATSTATYSPAGNVTKRIF